MAMKVVLSKPVGVPGVDSSPDRLSENMTLLLALVVSYQLRSPDAFRGFRLWAVERAVTLGFHDVAQWLRELDPPKLAWIRQQLSEGVTGGEDHDEPADAAHHD